MSAIGLNRQPSTVREMLMVKVEICSLRKEIILCMDVFFSCKDD
jgi:hypothetical protein